MKAQKVYYFDYIIVYYHEHNIKTNLQNELGVENLMKAHQGITILNEKVKTLNLLISDNSYSNRLSYLVNKFDIISTLFPLLNESFFNEEEAINLKGRHLVFNNSDKTCDKNKIYLSSYKTDEKSFKEAIISCLK